MRKLVATFAAAALLGGAGLAATGCGAEEAAGVDIAQAAERTAAKKTARATMTFRASGAGLPIPLDLKATGVTALDRAAGTLTMDLAPLLRLAGAQTGDGKLTVQFGGKELYVKPPVVEGFEVPGGKRWVSVDLERAARSFGLDTKGLGALLSIDPSTQLEALNAAKGLKEVGKEQVGGTETTHFRGTYTLKDFIARLPAAERASAERSLKDAEKLLGASLDTPQPADLWVDDEGVLRKMRGTTKLPAQGSTPAGNFSFDYVLSDFGTALDSSPPAASDTLDVTERLTELAKQFGPQLAGTGA